MSSKQSRTMQTRCSSELKRHETATRVPIRRIVAHCPMSWPGIPLKSSTLPSTTALATSARIAMLTLPCVHSGFFSQSKRS